MLRAEQPITQHKLAGLSLHACADLHKPKTVVIVCSQGEPKFVAHLQQAPFAHHLRPQGHKGCQLMMLTAVACWQDWAWVPPLQVEREEQLPGLLPQLLAAQPLPQAPLL